MLTENEKARLGASFRGRYAHPMYVDGLEFTLNPGQTKTLDLAIPSGTEVIPEGLNMEFEPEDNGECLQFIKIASVNGNTPYFRSPIRMSLLASPGAEGNTRFGKFLWKGALPGEDGLRVTIENRSSVIRKSRICLDGEGFIKLSDQQKEAFKRIGME